MAPDRLTRADAAAEIGALRDALLDAVDTERVSLDRLGGRVLAAAVTADRDMPRYGQATMDGYAVAAEGDPPREVTDHRVGPGDDPPDHRPGTATRVATGAPIPRGADAVVPVEDAAVEDGSLTVAGASDGVPAGQHVVARGSVVAAGEAVLAAGRRLAPRDAAVLRELGRDSVPVRRRLSTAVLATGTEIREGREPDRDSEFLGGLVRAWGHDPTLAGSVPDDPERVGERVESLAGDHDAVVTTGGTGVGAADETEGVMRDRADVRVAGVAMRPGSKVTVARLPDEEAVVASLPGPPGAAFASATLLLRPLFVGDSRLSTVEARTTTDLAVPDRDLEFAVPVEFRDDGPAETDTPAVVPFGHPSSSVELYDGRYRPHRVASCVRLSAADGVVPTERDLAAGERVAVVPYGVLES